VEPGEGALDDPAGAAEPGAVLGLATSDLGTDAAAAELTAVLVVVVTAISGYSLRPATRPTDLAAHGWDALEEWHELSDVVAVAAGDRPGERDPGRVYEKVMLGSVSGSINRARARRGAPFFACTWLESATARVHSISPAARNSDSNSACSRSQTPARCHSTMRR
jgi:hypothetical protein